jgi:hypothetical protein
MKHHLLASLLNLSNSQCLGELSSMLLFPLCPNKAGKVSRSYKGEKTTVPV